MMVMRKEKKTSTSSLDLSRVFPPLFFFFSFRFFLSFSHFLSHPPYSPLRPHHRLDRVRDQVPRLQAEAHPVGAHRDAVRDADRVEAVADHPGVLDPGLDLCGEVHEVHVAGVALVPDRGDADLLLFAGLREKKKRKKEKRDKKEEAGGDEDESGSREFGERERKKRNDLPIPIPAACSCPPRSGPSRRASPGSRPGTWAA